MIEIYTYLFRAEFLHHINQLRGLLPDADFDVDAYDDLTGCEVKLKSSLKLEQIMEKIALISEAWVMYETIEYEYLYTGKRIFIRSGNRWE